MVSAGDVGGGACGFVVPVAFETGAEQAESGEYSEDGWELELDGAGDARDWAVSGDTPKRRSST